MVLLDSNIFIVDRFFPRDSLYPQNKVFVEKPRLNRRSHFVFHSIRDLRCCLLQAFFGGAGGPALRLYLPVPGLYPRCPRIKG